MDSITRKQPEENRADLRGGLCRRTEASRHRQTRHSSHGSRRCKSFSVSTGRGKSKISEFRRGIFAENEKCSLDVFFGQEIEQFGRVLRVWAIVESERDVWYIDVHLAVGRFWLRDTES